MIKLGLGVLCAMALVGCKVSFGETDDGTGGAAGANTGGAVGNTGGNGSVGNTGGSGNGTGGSGTGGSATGGNGSGGASTGGAAGAGGTPTTGVCAPGACAASDLAVGLYHPERVVTDSSKVFFTDAKAGGRLLSVEKSGANVATLLEASLNVTALAEEGDTLYVADYNQVYGVPKSGGAPQPVTQSIKVTDIVPAEGGLWLVNYDGLDHYHFAKQKVDAHRSEDFRFALLADADLYLYQTYSTSSPPLVQRMPATGGTLAPLASGPTGGGYDPRAYLTVDGTSLFYFFHSERTVLHAMPKTGGSSVELAALPQGQVLDAVSALGGYVYFLAWDADYSKTTLNRVAAGGGSVDELFETDGECSHLALDDGFAYVTNRDLGKVHKVQR